MNVDAVIFDFDDTLVYSYATYQRATELFCAFLASYVRFGCAEDWAAYLHDQDIRNVRQRGQVSHHCFTEAMVQTFSHFSGRPAAGPALAAIERIRQETYMAPPAVIEGAPQLLAALQGRVRLYLITEGDVTAQTNRLQGSGLLSYFLAYAIVPHKNVDAYRELLEKWKIDASRSWMVGNSIRSDINPAHRAGLQTAHFLRNDWVYDREEAVVAPYRLQRLGDFLELIGDEA